MKAVIFFAGLILFFTSCTSTRYPSERRYPYPEDRGEREKKEDGRVYSFGSLGIPKGHLPPPGECKVWFPGKPAGQQPPPESCISALRNAPLGAWVITHEGRRYKVNIFNRTKRGIVDETRFYLTE